MFWNKKTLLLIILALIVLQLGLICFWLFFKQAKPSQSAELLSPIENYPLASAYSMEQAFYDDAYAQADNNFIYSDKVFVGILPHHLIVKGKVANFFNGLQKQKIKTVVLIGPNHFGLRETDILLSRAKWQTPSGDLLPETKLIDELAKQDGIKIDEQVFLEEHSISGLVGFIKRSLPEVKIVPIILPSKTTKIAAEKLAVFLQQNCDENTLVLGSVDFSHYQPAAVADFHDDNSWAMIENLDSENIWQAEVDSPASLAVVLDYAKAKQANKANLLWQTNSSRLNDQLDLPGTSHQFFYFTKGEAKTNSVVNLLFFGDMMLDRSVGTKIAQNSLASLLDPLAGEEKRFFSGSDLIAVNLEGAVTNNGEHYSPVNSNDFAFSPKIVSELKNYNFNFFNIANNHNTDQGNKGLTETAKNLNELGIDFSGCADAEANAVCSNKIIELKGNKIAMVGLSMVYHDFNLSQAQKIIAEQKTQNDLVIVNVHWGSEYTHQHNLTQEKVAHALIDSGADLIIGHHPHVIQGLEVYKDKLIFYSLGNFIFDQYFSADTQQGLSLGVSIDAKTKQANIYLYPLQSQASTPNLLKSVAKQQVLDNLIKWSKLPQEVVNMVKEGKIIL